MFWRVPGLSTTSPVSLSLKRFQDSVRSSSSSMQLLRFILLSKVTCPLSLSEHSRRDLIPRLLSAHFFDPFGNEIVSRANFAENSIFTKIN